MKKSILFLLLVYASGSFAQTGLVWSTPQIVANGSVYGNLHPRIVLNGMNEPVIIWGKGSANEEYCSRGQGGIFSAPLRVTPSGMSVFTASWAGPDIAAAGDTVFVVFKQQPEDTNHIYICRSIDGGLTFGPPVPVDQIADSISRFAAVTVKSGGNPEVAFMKFDPGFLNSRYVVTSSNDGGQTFATDILASGFSGGKVCDCCPATLLINDSYQLMLYRDNLNDLRDMWAGLSTDGGLSFSSGINVDFSNWNISFCPASGPDGVLYNDSLLTVWMSSASGKSLVHISVTDLISRVVSDFEITGDFNGLTNQDYPRIANYGNHSACAWKQVVNNNSQIAFGFSSGGWNGLINGYDVIASASGNNLVNVDLIVGPGVIHVVWQDDNSGNVMYSKAYFSMTGMGEQVDNTIHPHTYFSDIDNSVTVQWDPRNDDLGIVRITDCTGRTVVEKETGNSGRIEVLLPEISPGIYSIQLFSGKSVFNDRFILAAGIK